MGIISLTIKNKLKIWDLVDLDMGYHPAYSSAKDSVNILGMIAVNLKKDEIVFVSTDGLKEKIVRGEPVTILDVRSKKEFDDGSLWKEL